MKLFNPFYFSAIAILAVSAATAQEKSTFVAKKTALTEIQKQRWSHLDLNKDSIPGMSVDKVYSELLKNFILNFDKN